MKDKQVKAEDKASRKHIKQEMGVAILADLQKIAGSYQANSKKTNKLLQKAAQRLAKKLAKEVKTEKAAEAAKPKVLETIPTSTQPKADIKSTATPAAVVSEPVKAQPAEKPKRGPKAKAAATPLK